MITFCQLFGHDWMARLQDPATGVSVLCPPYLLFRWAAASPEFIPTYRECARCRKQIAWEKPATTEEIPT
jgi:hypothetical protein